MEDQIHIRKKFSTDRRTQLADCLAKKIASWTDADQLSKNVCVYTTGSFGRSDASEFSDLDVFVIARVEEISKERLIGNLQEIELLASIVSANRAMGFPDLDADGNFLRVHTISDYTQGLGKPDDDKNNTFTGRLLLLLESKPLFGNEVYESIKSECIHRYWNDYNEHKEEFLPAFFLNDILRFWRTLCVNYESGFDQGMSSSPAKRRAKNFKLKYSRVLTCFATVIALQAELARAGSVSPEAAIRISNLSPIERLEKVKEVCFDGGAFVDQIINEYNQFLNTTNCSKAGLMSKMEDSDYYRTSLESARRFGDLMFNLMRAISEGQQEGSKAWRFLRYATV